MENYGSIYFLIFIGYSFLTFIIYVFVMFFLMVFKVDEKLKVFGLSYFLLKALAFIISVLIIMLFSWF